MLRIMALDYGDARTGVAISDATGSIVGFTTVITQWNRDRAAEQAATEAAEREAAKKAAALRPKPWRSW